MSKRIENKFGIDHAIYGGIWSSEYSYINGYFYAAKILLDEEPRDLLIYPILYTIRHLIELHLKAIVNIIYKINDLKIELGEIKDYIKESLYTHSIKKLFNIFELRVKNISTNKFDNNIKNLIFELAEDDIESGEVFRYHISKDRTSKIEIDNNPQMKKIELNELKEKLEKIHHYLIGVSMCLDCEYYQPRLIMLEQIQDLYR